MLSYALIEALHQIPATIRNENFVIHTAFYIILKFMCLTYLVLVNTLLSKKINKREQDSKGIFVIEVSIR